MNERTVQQARKDSSQKARTMWLALGATAVLAVGGYWFVSQRGPSQNTPPLMSATKDSQAASAPKDDQTGRFPYKVARPGPGDMAPPIKLTTTRGTPFDLDTLRGQTVLLYFQEGLMCQACW